MSQLFTESSSIFYDYDHFDYCTTNESRTNDNIATSFKKLRVNLSPYEIIFSENSTCKTLCTKIYKGDDAETEQKLNILRKGISLGYQHHWFIDNIPVKWCYPLQNNRRYCTNGFNIGCQVQPHETTIQNDWDCPLFYSGYNKPGTFILYNHVDIEITYEEESDESNHIIFVRVIPSSIRHDRHNPNCYNQIPLSIPGGPLDEDETLSVVYTYSVKFIKN